MFIDINFEEQTNINMKIVKNTIENEFFKILGEKNIESSWTKNGLKYGLGIDIDISGAWLLRKENIDVELYGYRPSDDTIKYSEKIINFERAVEEYGSYSDLKLIKLIIAIMGDPRKEKPEKHVFSKISLKWKNRLVEDICEEAIKEIRKSINFMIDFSDNLNRTVVSENDIRNLEELIPGKIGKKKW